MVIVKIYSSTADYSVIAKCQVCNQPVGTKAWLYINMDEGTRISVCGDCFAVVCNGVDCKQCSK